MDFYRPPAIQGAIDALGTIYRALRAWKFYPKGHPNRLGSVSCAHEAALAMLDGNNLSLVCGRTSFSMPDGEKLDDSTKLSGSLSNELFVRRVQKITFLSDLRQEDLLALLRILSLHPDTIQKSGGVDKIMMERGIRSIWVNEFDLSVIRAKRHAVESRAVAPPGIDEADAEGDDTFAVEQVPLKSDDLAPEQLLPILLGRLLTTQDHEIHVMLVRQAISCSDALKARKELLPLFPLLELLAKQALDNERSENTREFVKFAIEQITAGNEFIRFALGRMEEADALSKDALQTVITAGGSAAVFLAVGQLGVTNNLTVRKTLSNILAALGEQALPPLLSMLEDKRWFVVRNIAVVLGAIASPDAVPGLTKCLSHSDVRVSREAVRSLARIGGREAETSLIALLQQDNLALYPQAIASLGGIKSRRSIHELLKIVLAKDLFLKSLSLKCDALNAIAMIGDGQVIPPLLKLLTTRHLLASGRWKILKTGIAQCLGRLGAPVALPELKKMSTLPGEVGAACSEAVIMIEKTAGYPDGGS